jgi:hypothetical protein
MGLVENRLWAPPAIASIHIGFGVRQKAVEFEMTSHISNR